MSVTASDAAEYAEDQIGPGRLLLVVGPSGAGKDTLIRLAAEALAGEASVVFPRRMVTRASSAAEDNTSMSVEEFEQARGQGKFALAWEAHGLHYGIPATIDADIGLNRTIVCNVSRTIVAEARRLYEHVEVVLVTAPHEVLCERLALRGRASDGRVEDRLTRTVDDENALQPDLVIENVGPAEIAAARLIAAVR